MTGRGPLLGSTATLVSLAICAWLGAETLFEHPASVLALAAAAWAAVRLVGRGRGPGVADALVLAAAWSLSPTVAALVALVALTARRDEAPGGWLLWLRVPVAALLGAVLTWWWVAHPPGTLGRALELAIGALALAGIDTLAARRFRPSSAWAAPLAAVAGAWALAYLLVPPQPWPLGALALALVALAVAPEPEERLRGELLGRVVDSLARESAAREELAGQLDSLQRHAVRVAPVLAARFPAGDEASDDRLLRIDAGDERRGEIELRLERAPSRRERAALLALAAVAGPGILRASERSAAEREPDTGLANRERFAEWVEEARARMARFKTGATIVLVEQESERPAWLARRRATDRVAALAAGRFLWLFEETPPEAVEPALERMIGAESYRFGAVAVDARTPLRELLIEVESDLKRRHPTR